MTSKCIQASARYTPYELLKPKSVRKGDMVGLFTPSWPGHVILQDKYQHSLRELQRIGFRYKEGSLTGTSLSQGYRSAPPQERAAELMELVRDPDISLLMATIGGNNSASLIPYLDFDLIRKSRKVFCGYSDITSLHLAIARYSGLATIYGPTLIPAFGEAPHILPYSYETFFNLISGRVQEGTLLHPPSEWSCQFIDATLPGWELVKRQFSPNKPWKVVSPGCVQAPLVVADLETLMSSAGTAHFPDLQGCILLLEQMEASLSSEERYLRQLDLIGAFDQIGGLIFSKPYNFKGEGAPFSHEDLVREIVGQRSYPIVMEFDCGHTFPMLSLAQGLVVSLTADGEGIKLCVQQSAVV